MAVWGDDPLPWEDSDEDEPDVSTADGLLKLLDGQAALLVDVATGGSQINSVSETYRRRRRQLNRALRAREMSVPFPFEDLWAWRGYWQAQGLTTYQSRRDRVADLARPAREALETASAGVQVAGPSASGSSTWTALDARLEGIIRELASASDRDDLQDVGRRCREVLIDAARLLANPGLVAKGAEPPKAGDAKAWLDLFLAQHASGRTHRELRAFVPVAWDLAQKVTHGGVDRVDAYAAAQATQSRANMALRGCLARMLPLRSACRNRPVAVERTRPAGRRSHPQRTTTPPHRPPALRELTGRSPMKSTSPSCW